MPRRYVTFVLGTWIVGFGSYARGRSLPLRLAWPGLGRRPVRLIAQRRTKSALVCVPRKVGREHIRRRIYRKLAPVVADELRREGYEVRIAPPECRHRDCGLAEARRLGASEVWTSTISVVSKVYAKGRVHHIHMYRWDAATGRLLGTFDKYAEIHYLSPLPRKCYPDRRAKFIGCGNNHLRFILRWLVRFILHPPKRPKPIPMQPIPPHPEIPGMSYVPAGDFIMGGYFGEFDEEPEHVVYLSAYYIDTHETSNAEYWECVRAHRCKPSAYARQVHLMHPNHPVLGVSWFDAREYCRWRGKRLPTEAEMEKAARGTDARRFPWGNTFDRMRLNLRGPEDGYRWTAPVDAFPNGRSPYGVYNLAGNVWEWCHDNIDKQYYRHSPRRDPQGPPYRRGMRKCMRGGTWMYNVPFYASTTNRSPQWGWKRYKYTGIRCALSASNRERYLRYRAKLEERLRRWRRRRVHGR